MSKTLSVEQWNEAHPVGTMVRYWRGIRESAPSGEGKTYHAATMLGGHTPVAWIEGCVGCIALTHVEFTFPALPAEGGKA